MKKQKVMFTRFELFFFIILTYISYVLRNFRLPRPQIESFGEKKEIDISYALLNGSHYTNDFNYIGRMMQILYLKVFDYNITSITYIFTHNYSYITLRQFSSIPSIITPSIYYLSLKVYGFSVISCITGSFLVLFSPILVSESRYYSLSGFNQLLYCIVCFLQSYFNQNKTLDLLLWYALISSCIHSGFIDPIILFLSIYSSKDRIFVNCCVFFSMYLFSKYVQQKLFYVLFPHSIDSLLPNNPKAFTGFDFSYIIFWISLSIYLFFSFRKIKFHHLGMITSSFVLSKNQSYCFIYSSIFFLVLCINTLLKKYRRIDSCVLTLLILISSLYFIKHSPEIYMIE